METHTTLNAVPQRDEFNSGIWLDLENKTAEWADQYGSVWIITGPIFYEGKPHAWLGEPGEIPAAIHDALFKVAVRDLDNPDRPEVLAFIYPQEGPDYRRGSRYQHALYLASVDSMEGLTNLDLLMELSDSIEDVLEAVRVQDLWRSGGCPAGNTQEADSGRVNFNTAAEEELSQLPVAGDRMCPGAADHRWETISVD